MTVVRKRLSKTDKLTIMVRQATCPDCGQRLGLLENCDFDHGKPLAISGDDSIDNIRAIHRDCHSLKTNGKPHDKSDGDKHKIAKVNNRLKPQHEEFRQKMMRPDKGAGEKPKKKKYYWPKRKFQNRK